MTSENHTLDPSILREYDIRGIVGRTLRIRDARTIGRAFGAMAAARGITRAAVGYDGRLSSPALEVALVHGLASNGIEVVRVGRGPTPMLYFALHHLDIPAGVMVTGSHNPPDYNGFKLLLDKTPLEAQEIQEIGTVVHRDAPSRRRAKVIDRIVLDAYVERLATEYRATRPLKVAWDCGNGATGDVVVQLCEHLSGMTHVLLNEAVDGTFPAHHPDPTIPANLRALQENVVAAGCDIGIAFDGDGDRLGVVDETGRILWPDQVLLLLARAVLRERPGAPIVGDVKSSQILFDGIAAAGGEPVMSPSGYTHIRRRMRELGAPLAGEMSGHIFFADRYHGVDDALYGAVRVLSILGASGHALSTFRESLPSVVNTPELRIPCPESRKRDVVATVAARLRAEGAAVVDIDGVRVRRDKGWWLLRASNTEPVLAARCEADDPAALDSLRAELAAQLAAGGVAIPDSLAASALDIGDKKIDEKLPGVLERT